MVVLDPALQQKFVADGGELPPWRDIAARPPAGESGHEVDAFIEHRGFLLAGHFDRVFMRITVNADFVTGVCDGAHLLRKRFDRMAGDEPRRLDAEPFEQSQQPGRPNLAGEQTARNIVRRILAAIGAEPAGDRIDVNAETAQYFLGHPVSPATV